MTAQKHTPGPWEAVQGGAVRADDGMRVADADGMDIAEMEANARLIAAAPEMLEALRDLLVLAQAHYPIPAAKGEIVRARAAIAKAIGQ